MTSPSNLDNHVLIFALTIMLSIAMSSASEAEGWWQARANFVAVDDGNYDGDHDLGEVLIGSSIDHDNSFSLSLERRFNDRLGLELWAFSTKPDFGLVIVDPVSAQVREGRDTLDIFAMTLGLAIHLTPKHRVDLYAQPLIGMMNVEDMQISDLGDTFNLEISDEVIAGFAVGVDVPLKTSRWSFNANLRYLDLAFEPKAEDGTSVTLRFEPIVVGLGLGFRF